MWFTHPRVVPNLHAVVFFSGTQMGKLYTALFCTETVVVNMIVRLSKVKTKPTNKP